MSLTKTICFIIRHPLNRGQKWKAIKRFFAWQINTKLNPYPVIYPFAAKSRLFMKKGLTGATGNLYCGLHEFNDMMFLLHYLREADLFIDIGANVGSYTVLGASEVGAKTVCIEPIPKTFQILKENLELNKITSIVTALNIGLGSRKDQLRFTQSFDTINHVASAEEKDSITVDVERFDEIFDLTTNTLIKIDVEGFETEVLEGMSKSITNQNLQAIIIELNGSGKRYGYDESKIHAKLLSNGFAAYTYSPFERTLTAINNHGTHNTIYIRNIDVVKERISSAKKFQILGKKI